MRALLDMVRKDRARVQNIAHRLSGIMGEATVRLKILDPQTGNRELRKLWEDEIVTAGLGTFQMM